MGDVLAANSSCQGYVGPGVVAKVTWLVQNRDGLAMLWFDVLLLIGAGGSCVHRPLYRLIMYREITLRVMLCALLPVITIRHFQNL